MSTKNLPCICEICNCGRHKCKIHPKRKVEGPCTLSEYTNKYTPHPIQPVGSCKPNPKAATSDGPLSDETTHRVDYIEHPLGPHYVHQSDQYKPPEGDFDGTTMYTKEFTLKQGPKVQPIKRDVNRGVPGEFQGEPTYKHDYRQWKLEPRERYGNNAPYQQPKDPFSGTPTYVKDYVPYKVRPPTSCKPNETAKRSDAPFDGDTDYRRSYVPHPLERRQERERPMYSKPSAPLDGLTTHTRDYTPKAGALRNSMKPNAQAFSSNAPFQSETTHKNDYVPRELQRPHVHQADPYVPPQGEIDGTTTYYKDYPAHPVVREPFVRRVERGKPSGPFQGTTDYHDNYKGWKPQPRQAAGPNQTYQPNSAPFEGQSTTSTHYVPHPLDPRRSFKPTNTAARNDGDFDDNTNYRMEYTPKHLDPCPAAPAVLEAPSSRFKFSGLDERGHQRYAPKEMTTITDLSNGNLVSCS